MANKKFQVEIDIDSKDVKIAGGEMLNLQQQLKVFQKELKSGKLGAEEFAVLSNKINETKDNLAEVNARSGEFFNTISMIPGPIGDIGNSLDSTIGLLKTFSGFSLKDLGSQFRGVFSDIGGVIKNLFGLNVAQTKTAVSSQALAAAEAEGAVAAGANAVAMEGATVATEGLAVAEVGASAAAGVLRAALTAIGIGLIITAVILLIENWDKLKKAVLNLIPGLAAVGDAISATIDWFTDLIGVTSEAERAEEKRQETYKKAAAATEIVNQGIQREIDLMKARGATQDDIDKKEKQLINNRLKDLKLAANERGTLFGEQAKEYKDLQNKLAVIDATAETKRKEEAAKNAKEAADKRKQNNQKYLQDEKQLRDKLQQYILEGRDAAGKTRENELIDEKKKFEELKAQAIKFGLDVIGIEKAYKEKVAQINKTYDDKELKDAEEKKKKELEIAEEKSKKELEILDKYYADRNKKIEFNRNAELKNEQNALKKKFLDGQISQQEFDAQSLQLGLNFAKKKQTQDDEVYNEEIAALTLKREQNKISAVDYEEALKTIVDGYNEAKVTNTQAVTDAELAIQENGLVVKKELIDKEKELEELKLQAKYEALDTIIQLAGAETNVGKAALVAKQILTAKELVMEIKKTITLASQDSARATVATAAGAAQTAKIGFPQNIPFLIAYAAQAASIIATIIRAVRGAKGAAAEAQSMGTESSPNVPSPNVASPINVSASRAQGGYVFGKGTSTSDSIPVMLSNGEFVMNARSSAMFGGLLTSMNDMGNQPQLAMGGLVGANGSPISSGSALGSTSLTELMSRPIKTYVTATDMTTQQQFERTIKSRSTI